MEAEAGQKKNESLGIGAVSGTNFMKEVEALAVSPPDDISEEMADSRDSLLGRFGAEREQVTVGLTPSLMALLVIFNAVTTALYTLLYKVGSSVYGHKHAAFLIWATCVVEYSFCTCVVLFKLGWRWGRRSSEPSSSSASVNAITVPPKVDSKLQYLGKNALVALCSSVPALIWAVTGVQVLSSIQAVLNLLLIPCTYFLARTFLKQRFHWWHQLGCALVVLGAGIAIIPSLREAAGSTPTGSAQPLVLVICYFLFAAANLPYAYQYIVVERMLRAGNDLFGLEMTSGWLQVLMLLILSPLQATLLRALGEEPKPFSLSAGFECFMGRDPDCLSVGAGVEKTVMPSWWPAFVLMIVSVASLFNDLAYYVLVQYGSAIFMAVAEGASAALVAVVATASFMGPYRETANVYMALSCIVCSFGMLAWQRGEHHAGSNTIHEEPNKFR
jgi:drug/metabolite transporter (DMT)-like permease